MRKILKIGLVLLIALLGTTIPAYAYYFVYLPSTIVYTAVTPDVQFYKWSDGTKQNNITLSFNFAANVSTYEPNATWAIRNSGGSPKTVKNWIDSITDTTKITNITIQIMTDDGLTQKALMKWVTGDPAPPTAQQSWSASAGTNYLIWIWCTGATSVADIHVTLGLQTTE
jgi:hypothetical protein